MHSRLTPRHLLAARPTDPFVRWRVDPEETLAVAVDGDHVGWTRRSESGTELWGTALGYAVWGEVPDTLLWVGAAIVAGSGLYIVHRETRLRVPRLNIGTRTAGRR